MILETTVGKFVVHISHSPQYGYTYVKMHPDNGKKCESPCNIPAFLGMADCAPEDQYCKRVGRKVAFAKALAEGEFDKPTRTAIWAAYKATTKYQRPARA